MAYAEKRGNLWRARWRGPDGTLESKPGFRSRKDAENYGRDQEAAVRNNTYLDPRAGRITLTEWVDRWFPAQDLELNTLSTYKYTIEVLILRRSAIGRYVAGNARNRDVGKRPGSRGYQRRTAREARSTLATILSDAIPRYIQTNPAARKRGKGRKGQRRIERAEKARSRGRPRLRRCCLPNGAPCFPAMMPILCCASRWPTRACGGARQWGYRRNACTRRRWISTGSCTSWIAGSTAAARRTGQFALPTCRRSWPNCWPGISIPTRRGNAPAGTPRRRGAREASTCSSASGTRITAGPTTERRIVRPAADGWYPQREGRYGRPAAPVLVDSSAPWPGVPLSPWPPATPGEPYTPPAGRGIPRLAGKDGSGRCPACNRTIQLRQDGTLIRHKLGGERCSGSEEHPASPFPRQLATATPRPHPHGLRHGHQTWLDDLGVRYVLQSERMGHEVPGMRGV